MSLNRKKLVAIGAPIVLVAAVAAYLVVQRQDAGAASPQAAAPSITSSTSPGASASTT